MSGKGKPPDFQFPHAIADIFDGQETEAFGENGLQIVKHLVENERAMENVFQAPDERFTLDGPIVIGTSPQGEFRYGGQISELVGRLKTAGSSDTVFDVITDIGTVGTVTIAAGDTRGETFVRFAVASRAHAVWVDVTSAGSGAEGLVVYVRTIASGM